MNHDFLFISEWHKRLHCQSLLGVTFHVRKSRATLQGIFLFALIFLSLIPFAGNAQSSTSNQFWSRYKLSHAFGNKWASEIDFTGRFSDTPEKKSILATRSQFGIQGWAHYHFSSRWRFSGSVGFYDNFYLPDIDQESSTEWRFTVQGVYFFHKIGYTFSTRGRAEIRNIHDEENGITNTFRYRQRVKYQKPLNSKSFRKGVFYVLASDELIFRINSTEDHNTFFDRNVLSFGGGYVLTDNLQLEMAYVNQFLPRSDGNQIIHALSFTITFNNLLGQIQGKFKKLKNNE